MKALLRQGSFLGATRQDAVVLGTNLAVVAVYACAFMAQVPLMPYLLNHLGAESSASFGALQTVFSLAQLLGGLLSGPLVDRYGGRALMLLSLWSSVLCYALTASTTTLLGLYVSRVMTVWQHAILAARTFVAAVAAPDARARLLGYLGVAYGLGFSVGPALGGVLSKHLGLRATAWAATAASVVSALAVHLLVPGDYERRKVEEHKKKAEVEGAAAPEPVSAGGAAGGRGGAGGGAGPASEGQTTAEAKDKEAARRQRHSWMQSLQVLKYAPVRQLMTIKLVTGLAGALLQSVFTLMLKTEYGLNSQANGLVLSAVGVVTMATQALLVELVRRRLGEGPATHAGLALLAASYLALACSRGTLAGLLLSLLPSAVGGSVLTTINTALLTQAAPPEVTGSVLALDMSLFSAVRLFTPAAGAALLQLGGSAALGCAAAALLAGLLLAIQLGWVLCDGGVKGAAKQKAA